MATEYDITTNTEVGPPQNTAPSDCNNNNYGNWYYNQHQKNNNTREH